MKVPACRTCFEVLEYLPQELRTPPGSVVVQYRHAVEPHDGHAPRAVLRALRYCSCCGRGSGVRRYCASCRDEHGETTPGRDAEGYPSCPVWLHDYGERMRRMAAVAPGSYKSRISAEARERAERMQL